MTINNDPIDYRGSMMRQAILVIGWIMIHPTELTFFTSIIIIYVGTMEL